MEKFDLYDRNRIPLGRSLERGTKPEEGEYRMVVHVCILNSKATKMLIQKRLKTKHPYPGKWDVSCGGSVISGETSDQGAHRELLEEIGIDVDF
ncbi:MAG: NUDIX domain-containing protein, partial [Clostridia bacterium]|nr:NUDIX domain-containing protein [Clostridia bacterium]